MERVIGNEGKILVQSNSDPDQLNENETYQIMDFHLVDLKTDNIILNYAPSLFQLVPPECSVVSANSIYLFGGEDPSDDMKQLEQLHSHTHSHMKRYLGGASCFHFDSPSDWCTAPSPVDRNLYRVCTSLFGKIYAFGFTCRVFDPSVRQWKPLPSLPPHLYDCRMSPYLIPDPSKHRILMLLNEGSLSSPTLFALNVATDTGETWEPLVPNFDYWTGVSTIVGDIIYFHCPQVPSIRAYDLATKAWLTVIWVGRFEDEFDLSKDKSAFDALFPLGNNVLCLAGWGRAHGSDSRSLSQVFFLRFKVERQGDTLYLFPISCPSYHLPDTYYVQNLFLM